MAEIDPFAPTTTTALSGTMTTETADPFAPSTPVPTDTAVADPFTPIKVEPKLTATKKVYAPGLLGGLDQFVTETFKAPATTLQAVGHDINAFSALTKANGPTNAMRAWGNEFRAKMGMPVTPEEEQSLAQDIETYRSSHQADPEVLKTLDHAFNTKMTPDELKEMNRGLVNIATTIAPVGKVTALAAHPIKNLLIRRVAQAEMHSIASMVAWTMGTNAANEEDLTIGVPQAALAGAILPPVAKGAGALAGQAVKYGTKGVGAVVGPAAAAFDRAAMKINVYAGVRNLLDHFWDYVGYSGEALLRNAGMARTADNLVEARYAHHSQAGTWHGAVESKFVGLSKQERETLGQMLHLPEVEAAKLDPTGVLMPRAKAVAQVLQDVAKQAEDAKVLQIDAATGELRRFKPRGDFGMPHVIVDTQQYISPGPIRDEALSILTKREKMPLAQAERVLETMHADNLSEAVSGVGKGYANLMGRRYGLPGFVQDPGAILPEYFNDMARKIELSRRFGGETIPEKSTVRDIFPRAFEGIDKLVEPERRQAVEAVVSGQLGQFLKGNVLTQKIAKLAQYQAVMKLGLAQFTQLTQFAATVAQTGFRDAYKDLLRLGARDPELHRVMLRTGAFMESLVRASQESMSTGGGITQVMKRTGFTAMDTQARRYGVLRGFSMASYQAEKLAELVARQPKASGLEVKYITGQIAKIEKKFDMLGIDGADLVKRGGMLSEDDLVRAGQKISTDVNFWSDSLSLPIFLKSPWGRILGQFKSFAFQQSKFIKDAIVKPALDGDLGPLVRTLPALAATGEVIADIKSLIRLKPRTDEGLVRVLNDLGAGGSFGIVSDGIQATNFSDGLLKWAAGPLISDVTDLAYGASDLIRKGKVRKLGKKVIAAGVPFIPYVGPIIAPAVGNVLFPPKQAAGQ
jgi:hypothetical protein